MKKNIFIIVLLLVVLGFAGYVLAPDFSYKSQEGETPQSGEELGGEENQGDGSKVSDKDKNGDEQTKDIEFAREVVIGKSAGGRDIKAYEYGSGAEILFVGGIHGGYSWNTSLLAYKFKDYIKENSGLVPADTQVTVIPVLNPDGLYKTVGKTEKFSAEDVSSFDPNNENIVAGRFNANNVDLNRNFDCDWQSSAKWRDMDVNGGSSAFSEPEAKAIKKYIEDNNIKAVVVWYAAAGGVYSSSCHNGVSDETKELTNVYAEKSGYPAYKDFDFYQITGDMVNWLAKEKIPAISVLLSNHEDIEWNKNKAGVKAVIDYYSN